MLRLAFALALLASPAAAQITPEEREARLAPLFETLASAPDATAAKPVADAIWMTWIIGPTQEATAALAQGMARIQSYDFAGALEVLDPIAQAHPDFAEVWNQKAFAHFLREEYDRSLDAIARTLELEPRHFGALAGQARILMRQGRMALGQKVLRRALDIHPWISERAVLLPVPEGRDI